MPAAIPAIIGAGASLYSASQTRKAGRVIESQARADRDKQNKILEQQKQEYRDIKFTNPYENMENTMEDLTVNKQQAQFQAQQGDQQRANIMQGLRGAAGSSGIAGLAQAMANQGQFQTQQISASIGAQEARNQGLMAGQAGKIQQSERLGDSMVQEAESGRQATLLGMEQGISAGANTNYQQALLNKASASASAEGMTQDAISGLAGADWSDIKKPNMGFEKYKN